jgi:mannosyltransferase
VDEGNGVEEVTMTMSARLDAAGPPAAAAVGVFGVLVGAAWAWSPSIWYDEAATLSAVRRPFPDMLDLTGHVDAVQGLYYVLAKSWTALAGDSITSLRLLSALGLGITAALTMRLTGRLSTPTAALVAGLAVVLLPGVSWSAVEARSFAWSAALAVLSTYLLVLAHQRRHLRIWVAYAVVLTTSNWLFLFSAPMMAVHGIALFLTDRRLPRGWVASAVTATLATVPLALAGFGQRYQISHIDLSLGEVAVRVLGAQTFMGPGYSAHERTILLAAGAVTAVLVTVVVASGMVRRRRLGPHDPLLLPLVWTWAVVPTLVIAGPHLLGAQVYHVRYLTYSVPAVAILVGVGLSTYDGVRRLALAAVLVVAVIPPLLSHHLPGAKSGEDYRGLAALAETWDVDAVVFAGAGSRSIKVAYPEPFRGTEDLVLHRSATSSDTLFGLNAQPRSLRAVHVRGKTVLYYWRSDHPPDRYGERLRRLGCRPAVHTVRTIRWRFSATVLSC